MQPEGLETRLGRCRSRGELARSPSVGSTVSFCTQPCDDVGWRTPSTRTPSPPASLSSTSDPNEFPLLQELENRLLSNRYRWNAWYIEPRPLKEITADIFRGISALEFTDFQPSSSRKSSQKNPECQPAEMTNMAGSVSLAMLQNRRRPSSCPVACRGDGGAAKTEQPLDRQLVKVFKAFAAGRKQMYWNDFARLCRTSLLFDAEFMMTDARRCFGRVLREGQRHIELDQFEVLLKEVSFERSCGPDVVHQRVSKCVEFPRRQGTK